MIETFEVHWIYCEDKLGNFCKVVFGDWPDIIQIYGLADESDSNRVHFESDAVHARGWAASYGFKFLSGTHSFDVEIASSVCRFCGRKQEGNAGDYYHEKSCHSKDVLKRLKEETDPNKIRILKRELELARYVGD